MIPDFHPDFASAAEWARMYRALGLQVVPARFPMRTKEDKRPKLANWIELQNALAPESAFEAWFPAHAAPNMGVITGAASGGLVVIDIDDYRSGHGAEWWLSVTGGLEPETWCQATGGGGRQYFFRLPGGERIGTGRTAIADIRGQGGFAMLPPSRHLSGRAYEWQPHRAPWDIEIAEMPRALIAAVRDLLSEHGRASRSEREVVAAPADYDAFGNLIDGRESEMARLVWGAVLDLKRRMDGLELDEETGRDACEAAFAQYLSRVRTRIPGIDNAEGLEREGRGWSLFQDKWRDAMRKWNGKVAEVAAKPTHEEAEDPSPPKPVQQGRGPAPRPASLFEVLDVRAIKTLPDPEWLVDGLVIERALGFIFGPPGSGKTFVSLSMALSIAVALADWWGRRIERRGAVVYISSEGQADLKFRIMAWEQANRVLTDDAPFSLIRQNINFMSPEDIGTLLDTLDDLVARTGIPIAAVFVDTVSRTLPGADENLQKDMTLFIRACDAVRERFGATVIGVHHTSRAGNLRGSTVFDGAGDFLLQVEREEGESLGALHARKVKAAKDGWKEHFRLDTVACGDNAGNASLVALPALDPAAEQKRESFWPDKDTCRRVLAAIRQAWERGQPWSMSPQARGRHAPKHLFNEFGIKPRDGDRMLETWLMNGVLTVAMSDPHTKTKGLKVTGGIDG